MSRFTVTVAPRPYNLDDGWSAHCACNWFSHHDEEDLAEAAAYTHSLTHRSSHVKGTP